MCYFIHLQNMEEKENGCLNTIMKSAFVAAIFGVMSLTGLDLKAAWITFIICFLIGIIIFGYNKQD